MAKNALFSGSTPAHPEGLRAATSAASAQTCQPGSQRSAALQPMRAVRRSLALLGTLGAGFLPAVLGDDRRAIHDRVAGTRVVAA